MGGDSRKQAAPGNVAQVIKKSEIGVMLVNANSFILFLLV